MARIARGNFKPPFGALVNPTHPFARGLLLALPFNGALQQRAPGFPDLTELVLWGSVARRAVQSSGAPTAVSTSDGWGWQGDNIGGSGALILGPDFLPAAATTVCVVAQKRTSALPNQVLFGNGTGDARNVGCSLPWTDGTAYWDFGGNSGSNRLAVSGLTFNPNRADRWVLTAGPRGMQMWQNGVRVGNQTTVVTRTVDTTQNFSLWVTYGSPSAYPLIYFAAYDHQWDEALCRAWSAEPYAHLYQSKLRRSVVPGPAAAPITRVVSTSKAGIGVTTPTTTTAIDTTGASLLEVSISYYNGGGGVPVLTDSKNNVWNPLTGKANNAAGMTVKKFYAYCFVSGFNGPGHTFTVTGTPLYAPVAVCAYAGTNLTFASESTGGTASGVTSLNAGSVTPPVNGSLITTAIGAGNAPTGFVINGESLAIQQSVTGVGAVTFGLVVADEIQTTAAALNPLWNGWSPATDVAAVTATYYSAAVPPLAPIRISQVPVETLSRQANAPAIRITQVPVETLTPTAPALGIRITQVAIETLSPGGAGAVPPVVQVRAQQFAFNTSFTLAFTTNVTAGNTLAVFATLNGGTLSTPSISDSRSNSYTRKAFDGDPTIPGGVWLWTATANATGSVTVTIAVSGAGTGVSIGLMEILTGYPFTSNAHAAGNSATAATSNLTTLKTGVVVAMMGERNGGGAYVDPAGWTLVGETTSTSGVAQPYSFVYQIGAAGVYSPVWTWGGGARSWAVVAASFERPLITDAVRLWMGDGEGVVWVD